VVIVIFLKSTAPAGAAEFEGRDADFLRPFEAVQPSLSGAMEILSDVILKHVLHD